MTVAREALVRRGLCRTWFGIVYNVGEAIIASGIAAASVALIGFGIDSASASNVGRSTWSERTPP